MSLPPLAVSALLGRQHEQELIWQQFEQAALGRAGVVLLAGEPGIGKSALLDWLADRARGRGAAVLRGGASEASGMPPYLPFIEALGGYVLTADLAALRDQVGPDAATLARILPELAWRLGDLPPGYPLPPEQARLRLFEAVGALLAAAAVPRGLVLILDDLHWADRASLELLAAIARRQPTARLLVVAAYRAGEIADQSGFTQLTAELARLRRLTSLTLDPLGRTDLADLARANLGAPVSSRLVDLLHRHSEGNPFFAEELLRGWAGAGALARAGGEWSAVGGELAVPPSILVAIDQRVARLDPAVVDLLRLAALIGRTFDADLLAQVAGLPAEPAELLLAHAARAQLVRAQGDRLWIFGHDMFREALYAGLGAARRRRMHGEIGRAIEARPPAPGAQRLADLAFHFARSGDAARGAEYARQAADQALRAYAPAEALAHYRAARDLAGADDPRHGDTLLGFGAAASLAGEEHQAQAAFEAARDWFVAAGQPLQAAHAALGAGRAAWRREALDEARAVFGVALELAGPGASPAAVEALVELGSLLAVSLHRQEEGIAHGRRALDLAQCLEEPLLVAKASRVVGNLLVRSNHLAEGLALLDQALELADAAGDPSEAAECCACLTIANVWNTSVARCYAVGERALGYIERTHDLYLLRHLYAGFATLHSLYGEWDAAERMIARAQEVIERLASPEPAGVLQMNRGFLAYDRGDYAAAESYQLEATATFRALGPNTLVWYLGLLGMAQAAQGKRATAVACMEELAALIDRLPPDTMPTGEPLSHLVTIALALGDRDRIAAYGPRLAAFRGQYHDALVDRLLGEVALAQGDWPVARDALESAAATAERERLRPELARTLAAQARLALAWGGPGRAADELLGQAIELWRALGNSAEAARLRALAGSRQPEVVVLPAGLSAREAEVLRLVAAGKSNRQIAAELNLSVKTVANHLGNILGKTGSDNRAAAAAFAIRHGLA